MGLGRPRVAMSRLRVKVPKHNIVPLSVNEVARFWSSFRASRDLVIVGLMVLQGLRSAEVLALNRYHRHTTGIQLANPHRFRHTFGSDMVRAGMSLLALMQLMGHADIQTTLRYVQVTPQDVYLQYACAVAKHIRPLPKTSL
jgi:integrase